MRMNDLQRVYIKVGNGITIQQVLSVFEREEYDWDILAALNNLTTRQAFGFKVERVLQIPTIWFESLSEARMNLLETMKVSEL